MRSRNEEKKEKMTDANLKEWRKSDETKQDHE